MYWERNYHVNLALRLRVARAPDIFNRGGDLLEWIFGDSDFVNEEDIQHYYDDFLAVGPANSNSCEEALDTCLYLCGELVVPIDCLKTVCPSTCLIYLGYVLDSLNLELRLPREKQNKVLNELSFWTRNRAGRQHKLLSLIELLQHCTQAIPRGRPSLRGLIDRTHSVKQLDYFVCLSPWEKNDSDWWYHLICFCSQNGRLALISPCLQMLLGDSYLVPFWELCGLQKVCPRIQLI